MIECGDWYRYRPHSAQAAGLSHDEERRRRRDRAGLQTAEIHPMWQARGVPGDLVRARALRSVLERRDAPLGERQRCTL